MSQNIEKITVTGESLTISRLIWNRFQAPMPGLLGQIYDLNPKLSHRGTHLAIGTEVMIPIPETESGNEVINTVTLWS